MNKRYKYRFKTETEFIDEFGDNWRKLSGSFVSSMNYLLRTEIDRESINSDISHGNPNIMKFRIPGPNMESYHWTINNRMIIVKGVIPVYKPIQLIY